MIADGAIPQTDAAVGEFSVGWGAVLRSNGGVKAVGMAQMRARLVDEVSSTLPPKEEEPSMTCYAAAEVEREQE